MALVQFLPRGGIFGQFMGLVPIQHHEEFGKLLIFSGNPGIENQQLLTSVYMQVNMRPAASWQTLTLNGQLRQRISNNSSFSKFLL